MQGGVKDTYSTVANQQDIEGRRTIHIAPTMLCKIGLSEVSVQTLYNTVVTRIVDYGEIFRYLLHEDCDSNQVVIRHSEVDNVLSFGHHWQRGRDDVGALNHINVHIIIWLSNHGDRVW